MQAQDGTRGAVALVTGASSGIGAAIAGALVPRGWRVIAAARRIDRLRALAERLGPACLPFELDVADAASAAGLLDRLPPDWRGIDALVNNAGHDVGGKTPFDGRDAADWTAIIETNVNGMIRVSHAVAPAMLARGGGHIVNIGSIAGLAAYPGGAAYVASKFAVDGFSKALRLDYLGKIRVSQILPGVVRTEFDEVRRRGDRAQAEAFYGGFPECLLPEDVADCVVFALERPARVNVAELLVLPSS